MIKLTGNVIHGKQQGTVLGWPTINLDISPPTNVQFGVYAGKAFINNRESINAAIIIGIPNQQNQPSIEAHLINYQENLYGQTVTLELLEFIRPLIQFESQQELIKQIERDIRDIKKIISSRNRTT